MTFSKPMSVAVLFSPAYWYAILAKGEVLRYVNEGKIAACDTDVLCDTSTDDNV